MLLSTSLKASRPISWINTAAPFVAALIVTGTSFTWQLALTAFFFLIPYNLLMYGINDIFDYESDRQNPRKNSVEGAVVAPKEQRGLWIAILVTNIPFFVFLLTQGNLTARAFLVVSLFMVVAYSAKGLRFKEIPFLDSFTSSWHFWSPLAYGLILVGSITPFWSALLAFVLWGMASHAMGAIQDIAYDRAGGIASIATALGARATAWFGLSLYGGAVLIAGLAYAAPYGWLSALTLALYILLVIPCLKLSDATAAQANRSWKHFLWVNQVAGMSLTVNYLAYREVIPFAVSSVVTILAFLITAAFILRAPAPRTMLEG